MAESEEAGVLLAMAGEGRQIFVDRRNREDLVGCTGQQSFDLVCSTDGFEETRAEKGCGGTACVT